MVYLLHFHAALGDQTNPRGQARHYIGYAADVERRLAEHRAGTGAAIMAAVTEAGIAWECVRVWEGGRTLERQLKNSKRARRFCPICNPERAFIPLTKRRANDAA